MGHSKVPMELIKDEKKRKSTFQRRKDCIIKKAHELKTLCDVNVCGIICTDDQKLEIFPADPQEFNTLANRYRSIAPDKIRYSCLSDFINDTEIKTEEEPATSKKKNVEGKYPTWFDFLDNYSEMELREYALKLDTKINCVKNKIESMKKISKIQPTLVLDDGQSSMVEPSSTNPPIMTEILKDANDPDTVNQETTKKPAVFYHWL